MAAGIGYGENVFVGVAVLHRNRITYCFTTITTQKRPFTPRHYRQTPVLVPLDAMMLSVVSQSVLPFERHQQHQSIPNRCQLVQLDLNHHISQTNAVAAT